jgi:hypothetical protein
MFCLDHLFDLHLKVPPEKELPQAHVHYGFVGIRDLTL